MMFWRMVIRALIRQRRKMLMIACTIALGVSLATAMLNVMFDVGDKINQELKTYGANIRVVPQAASLLDDMYGLDEGQNYYLREDELGNIKTIFWAFNIVDFAPYLASEVHLNDTRVRMVGTWFRHHMALPTGEELDTGMTNMKSWWDVQGRWLTDDDAGGALVGSLLAARNGIDVGDVITLSYDGRAESFRVNGIFDGGGDEDEYLYVPLAAAQALLDKGGLIDSIEVSALTTPDNELSRRAAQNPKSLSAKDLETWYCTAYVSSICYQIQEVISDALAKPVRQVAESEGSILNKTQLLMLLITVLSLAAAALGISNLVVASVMERSKEIGLLKALGAHDGPISRLVLTEIAVTAIIGGGIGYFAGLGFAAIIGRSVFDAAIAVKPLVIPLVAVLVCAVTLAGSIPSIRLLLSLKPAAVLHGR